MPGRVHDRLDAEGFQKYLDGFQEVVPEDLLEGAEGGRLRYAIETLDRRGRVVETRWILGGWISHVDPELRYISLINPMVKTPTGPARWCVQLHQPGKHVRLWYFPRATSREVAGLRALLDMLDRGELKIMRP